MNDCHDKPDGGRPEGVTPVCEEAVVRHTQDGGDRQRGDGDGRHAQRKDQRTVVFGAAIPEVA